MTNRKIMIEVEIEDGVHLVWDVLDAVYHVSGVVTVVAMKTPASKRASYSKSGAYQQLVPDESTRRPNARDPKPPSEEGFE